MVFRFTLTDEASNTKVISEPGGWENSTIGFDRHKDFHSLIEYYKGSFQTYGSNGLDDGGRDWILSREKLYGPDADIQILIEIDPNESGTFETLYSGLVTLGLLIETLDQSHLLEIVFTQNDFWTRFINRYKSQVDIRATQDLDGNTVTATPKITLPLPSQTIRKNTIATRGRSASLITAGLTFSPSMAVNYLVYSFTDYTVNELKDIIDGYVWQFNTPWDNLLCILNAAEKIDNLTVLSADTTFDIVGRIPGGSAGQQVTMQPFMRASIGGVLQSEVALCPSQTGGALIIGNIAFQFTFTLPSDVVFNLGIGDKLYFYYKFQFSGTATTVNFDIASTSGAISKLHLTGDTSFTDSSCDSFLTHDVAAGVLDRIAGQTNLFYSEYLGNPYTSRAYGATGCGSLLANMKGLQLRGYNVATKPFFMSFEDWFTGINPIHNIGLGYDKVSGNDVIRVEEKAFYYDDSSMSILLSNVYKIKRVYDPDLQFSEVKIGYQKWQSQAASGVGTPSGIDDPQSVRTYASRFKKIGKPLQLLSKWVAASLTIETTRRVGILQSANYTYDNETFVIALKSNGDGTFTPELSENFSSITNLTNSATRYNSRLTPARNFLRWLNYLSGGLQDYLSSFFKFTSGEGNYTMASTMTTSCPGDDNAVNLAENQDIQVGTDFLSTAQLYEIEHYLDWADYKTFRDNRRKAIGISQTTTGHKKFFVKSLDYQLVKGTVKIQAWAKEPFDIVVPDSPANEHLSDTYYERPGYEGSYE